MRKPLLLIFTNAALVLAAFGLLAQSLFVVRRVARVQKIEGDVSVQRSGASTFTPLKAGETLRKGDTVRTSPGSSAEFRWLDGTRWKLFPRSELTLREATVDARKPSEVSRLYLASGQILVRVAKPLASTSSFEVETLNSVIKSQGQIFRVAMRPGTDLISVFKGNVAVSSMNSPASVLVNSGIQATEINKKWSLKPQDDQSTVLAHPEFFRPILEAEVQKGVDGNALLQGQTEPQSRVSIGGKPIPVAENGSFSHSVALAPGKNQWKIQSTDSYGATATIEKSLDMETHCPTP
ncbi:MAG TPA: FecR domain-containing protein [Abditibacterium sp.]|jgi:hypothetical protein